jgi:hypothetical protein
MCKTGQSHKMYGSGTFSIYEGWINEIWLNHNVWSSPLYHSQCMVKSTLPLTMYGQVHFTTQNVWSSPLYHSQCMVKSTLLLTMYGQVHFTTHNVWSSPLYYSQCMVKSTLLLTMYGQVHFTTHNVWMTRILVHIFISHPVT